MAWFIPLDSGPLGLACLSPHQPAAVRFAAWVGMIESQGGRIVVPEIADYEVRRELMRIGARSSLDRLDRLRESCVYDPITTLTMRKAAEFWAAARSGGRPTADRHALDGDVILAARATLLAGPGDAVTVATTNPKHLARFVDARDWATMGS